MLLTLLALQAAPPPPVLTVPVVPPRAGVIVERVQGLPLPTDGIELTPPAPELFERAVKPQAVAPLHTYVTADDYPAEARRLDQQGLVEFALRIDPDGRPRGCSILRSSNSSALDSTTCRLMLTRPRFTPGRDATGQAVESATKGRMQWRLPPAGTPPPLPDRLVMRYRLTADGRMADCTGEATIGTRRVPKPNSDCPSQAPPAPFVAAIRNASRAAEPRLRLDTQLITDPSAPWPKAAADGGKLIARSLARLVVEPDGKVSGCQLVDSLSLGGEPLQPCRRGMTVNPTGLRLPGEVRLILWLTLEGEPLGE